MILAMVVLSLIGAVDETTIVVALVSVILGGGLTGGLIPIFKYRQEKDSAIAVGAEAAVQSLTAALQASDARVNICIKENEELRQIVGELRDKLGEAQTVIRDLANDCQDLKTKLNRLLKE